MTDVYLESDLEPARRQRLTKKLQQYFRVGGKPNGCILPSEAAAFRERQRDEGRKVLWRIFFLCLIQTGGTFELLLLHLVAAIMPVAWSAGLNSSPFRLQVVRAVALLV